MGIDPGFAELGISIVEKVGLEGSFGVKLLRNVTTRPTPKKDLKNMRKTIDDLRRYREIADVLRHIMIHYRPYSVGVEVFTPMRGKQTEKWTGQNTGSMKALAVYGGVIFSSIFSDLFVSCYLPSDVRRRFCEGDSGKKIDVENVLRAKVDDFDRLINDIPKSKREHVTDATAHAILVMEEAEQVRQEMGLV